METPTRFEYNLPIRNEALFAARKYHENRIQASRGKDIAVQINKLRLLNQMKEEVKFTVEMLPAMSQISFANSIVIRGGLGGGGFVRPCSGLSGRKPDRKVPGQSLP